MGNAESERNHEHDGNFPHGVPNPLLEDNRIPTVDALLDVKADMVIAWDGDFDCCFLSVSLNFIAQGIVFTCSGVFQRLGNTRPALVSSMIRVGIFVPLAWLVSIRADFELRHIWYVSVVTVLIQAILSFVLVQRELRLKLPAPVTDAVAAT
jgi:hypothetical protein